MRDEKTLATIAVNAAHRLGCDCRPAVHYGYCVTCGDVERVELVHAPACAYDRARARKLAARFN